MPLIVGLNHETAPIEIREKLAVAPAQLPALLKRFKNEAGAAIEQLVLLSTCNRTEIYAQAADPLQAQQFLIRELHEYARVRRLEDHLYCFEKEKAIRHLFQVAAGLDSMVKGENEILAQVKEAYRTAHAGGFTAKLLNVLFQRSLFVGKRVRTETGLSAGSSSVGSVAVAMAQRIFGSLSERTVMILGAGHLAEATARYLLSQKTRSIWVANRTRERAEELARQFKGRALSLEEGLEAMRETDIVICSAAAPEAVVTPERVALVMSQRRGRSLFFIDIAVPRNVDPGVNKLDGLFVYDVDDLQSVASNNSAERKKEAERAEKIVEAEVDRFAVRMKSLHLVPTIVSLQEYCETIRQAEIDRIRGRLGSVTPEQEAAIEAMTRGIINKLLHTPITTLKSSAAEPEAATIQEMVRKLFNLNNGKPKV